VILDTSVVIPTLNDASTLGSTLERLNPVMATTNSSTEVVIVDAGSTDRTLEVAADCADRLPLLHVRILVQDRKSAGFGSLLRLGTAYAHGRYCVVVMPDARDPLELVPEMLDKLRRGAHLVLCSRYEPTGGEPITIPWRFRTYQTVYRRAIRALLGADIPDTTYGFRAFNRTFVQALGLNSNRLSVCPEITFKVMLAGGEITRVAGTQTAPMIQEQSKFRLRRELIGYAATLARAAAHRFGLRWF
jgi:glycosyltransferase involved in cell wall biosynthesis